MRSVRRLPLLAIVLCLLSALFHGTFADVPGASATFVDAADITQDLDAGVLDAPTNLAITSAAGTSSLNWTSPTSSGVTAIQVQRGTALGGPYAVIGTVTPGTVSYSDSPGPGGFYYVVRTVATNWLSPLSNEVNTVFTAISTPWFTCTAQVADTGGDGNGYETNSASGCGDDNVPADDINSGTGISTSCTNAAKDRHRFSNFSIVLPALATIRGVEVRSQSWLKSATTGTNKLCAQLSTDGGTTWTTPISATGLAGSEKPFTFGSTSNLWGRTFLTAQFTNPLLVVRVINVAKALNKTFATDTVEVRVTYS